MTSALRAAEPAPNLSIAANWPIDCGYVLAAVGRKANVAPRKRRSQECDDRCDRLKPTYARVAHSIPYFMNVYSNHGL